MEALSARQTDLVADEVDVGHGGGLILLAAVQTGGHCELAVRHPRLQTATPEHTQHGDVTLMLQSEECLTSLTKSTSKKTGTWTICKYYDSV